VVPAAIEHGHAHRDAGFDVVVCGAHLERCAGHNIEGVLDAGVTAESVPFAVVGVVHVLTAMIAGSVISGKVDT
jgi:hypothetical protein